MKLYTNSVSGDQVREETRDGTDYLVAPIRFIRSMDLHRGYVPNDEVEKSTDDWQDIPIVPTHPKHNGDFISVNSEHSDQPEYGFITNPESDEKDGDVVVEGEVWVNIDTAQELGDEPEDVVEALQNGQNVQVSSAYGGTELPAGEYDGEVHANVKGNLSPDHVAVFTDGGLARCKLGDGCGAGPIAANEVMVNALTDDSDKSDGDPMDEDTEGMDLSVNKSIDGITFTGLRRGSLEKSAIPDDEYESHYVFDRDTKSASGFPLVDSEKKLRYGNVRSAFRFRGDAPDTEKLLSVLREVNQEFANSDDFEEPPINPESLEEAMSANSEAMSLIDRAKEIVGISANESAEPDDDNTMNDKQEFLVNARGYDAENLPPEGSDCLDQMYANEQQLAEMEEEEEEAEQGPDHDEPEPDDTNDEVLAQLQEMQEKMVTVEDVEETVDQKIAANQEQTEKEQHVETILANSEDWDEDNKDELLETPTTVLANMADDVSQPSTGSVDFRGRGGAGSPDASSSDGSDMPALSANARLEETESDD